MTHAIMAMDDKAIDYVHLLDMHQLRNQLKLRSPSYIGRSDHDLRHLLAVHDQNDIKDG